MRKSPCWIFSGPIHKDTGYGREVGDEGAHRYSYRTYIGNIPKGFYVCHSCDNPACVRPDHLFLGSPKDNTQDMMKKGRHRFKAFLGERHWKSKLTWQEVLFIKNTKLGSRRYAVSAKDLSKEFHVSVGNIHKIRERYLWDAKGD